MCCEASHIPDRLFMEAAEAVANSLDKADMELDSVLPSTGRIREVGHNVALRVVLAAQEAGQRATLHWHRTLRASVELSSRLDLPRRSWETQRRRNRRRIARPHILHHDASVSRL